MAGKQTVAQGGDTASECRDLLAGAIPPQSAAAGQFEAYYASARSRLLSSKDSFA
jgi:hypothetical protein